MIIFILESNYSILFFLKKLSTGQKFFISKNAESIKILDLDRFQL